MKAVVLPQTIATVALNHRGGVSGMNTAAEKLLGSDSSEFVQRATDGAFENGEVMTVNNRAIQLDTLMTDHGRFLMLVDISPTEERQRREIETLRGELQKARELAAVNTSLSAAIAYEFGTPISAIRLKTVILKKHLNRLSPERVEQYVEQIDAQLNRMSDLLDDLLLVNQFHNPQSFNPPVQLNLEAFCRELIDELALRWEQREVLLTMTGQIDQAQADLRLIRYALSNLIDNALKFSPKGGLVEVEVRAEVRTIVLTVSDHGIGIPAPELASIFSPFFRASNATDYAGTGIGLAIMKTHIEINGGSISLDSRLGEGSRFTVVLPLRPA